MTGRETSCEKVLKKRDHLAAACGAAGSAASVWWQETSDMMGGMTAHGVSFLYPALQMLIISSSCFLLILMAEADIRCMIIPDRLVLMLGAAAVAASAVAAADHISGGVCSADLSSRICGFFIISVPMLLLNIAVRGCFGGGDIKLTAVCGFLAGASTIAAVMMWAFVSAGVFAFVLMIAKKKDRRQHFAFGPFICIFMCLYLCFPGVSIWSLIP